MPLEARESLDDAAMQEMRPPCACIDGGSVPTGRGVRPESS